MHILRPMEIRSNLQLLHVDADAAVFSRVRRDPGSDVDNAYNPPLHCAKLQADQFLSPIVPPLLHKGNWVGGSKTGGNEESIACTVTRCLA